MIAVEIALQRRVLGMWVEKLFSRKVAMERRSEAIKRQSKTRKPRTVTPVNNVVGDSVFLLEDYGVNGPVVDDHGGH